jgi:hypothetical protein
VLPEVVDVTGDASALTVAASRCQSAAIVSRTVSPSLQIQAEAASFQVTQIPLHEIGSPAKRPLLIRRSQVRILPGALM